MNEWEAAYQRGETPWELGQPAPPLVDLATAYRDRLGRVLVPGCGRGDDALSIAALGATVAGWDIAPTAITAARERARARGLAAAFAVRDALNPAPGDAGTFDTWIEHTFFTALPPELRPRYVAAAARLLRPGGLILGLFLIGEEEGGPPFAVTERELRALFAPSFQVITLAPPAHSPGRWAGRARVAALKYSKSARLPRSGRPRVWRRSSDAPGPNWNRLNVAFRTPAGTYHPRKTSVSS